MSEQRWSIRVHWHPYDGQSARTEWLELPPELVHASAARRSEWIRSCIREREGLPPDVGSEAGERALWLEWDYIRPSEEISKNF